MSKGFDGGVLQRLLQDVEIPPMMRVRQEMNAPRILPEQLPDAIAQALAPVLPSIRPGMRVGLTAGSRGIDQIPGILAGVAAAIRQQGAEPFLVPCMGSHGNQAEGQRRVLEGLGITLESTGTPILAQDELVALPPTADGRPVYMDRLLWEADGIVVINRVKAHTAFRGAVESGLCKMMAVGMGKQRGAAACHRDGFAGMHEKIQAASQVILDSGKICFGLAILENAYGQLARLEAVPAARIKAREPELLQQAKALMPAIPFDAADVLIVDEIGKDVSGSGMDTNVIGRYPLPDMTGGPRIQQLVALSLTAASEGSGHGMGFADFISARLYDALDFEKTYPNGLTNRTSAPGKIPPVMPNDQCAIRAAIHCLGPRGAAELRMVRIRNTHQLDSFWITPNLLRESRVALTALSAPTPLVFDAGGMLL